MVSLFMGCFSFADPDKEIKAPNLSRWNVWCSQTSLWVTTEILRERTLHVRVSKIRHLIDVCRFAYSQLDNYNLAVSILVGLQQPAVTGLQRTWQMVAVETTQDLEQLRAELNPRSNSRMYHAVLESSHGQPAIPYLGECLFIAVCRMSLT